MREAPLCLRRVIEVIARPLARRVAHDIGGHRAIRERVRTGGEKHQGEGVLARMLLARTTRNRPHCKRLGTRELHGLDLLVRRRVTAKRLVRSKMASES